MLKISRDDVSSSEITIFPQEQRFLKLPVERYATQVRERRVIDGELNGPQVALINAVNNPKYRFIVAALSRRDRKSVV